MDQIFRAIADHAPPRTPEPSGPFRRASVALTLRQGARGPELLMIKRAEHEGDPWSGHMAFPGGKTDPTDDGPLHTARREAREELGLRLEGARVLGELNPLLSPTVQTRVRPHYVHGFVFGIPGLASPLVPNDEVASVHWFGLDRMLQGEGRGTFPYQWRGADLQLPCFRLDGQLIWGMSLRLIDDLLTRVRRVQA